MKIISLLLTLLVLEGCASKPPPTHKQKELSLYSRMSIFVKDRPGYVCAEKYGIHSASLIRSSTRDRGPYKHNFFHILKKPLELNYFRIASHLSASFQGSNVKKALVKYSSEDSEWVTRKLCNSLTFDGEKLEKVRVSNIRAAKELENQKASDEKTCKEDFSFEEGTEAYSNCLMKQSELRQLETIAEENKSTIINEAPKKSSGGSSFCQKMPGAYTTTYHCW
tara:strand:+ start:771 stop:1439 length:669 start_codon:yes stop_codon:yes gene_type:complete